jgi:hypothetical protein
LSDDLFRKREQIDCGGRQVERHSKRVSRYRQKVWCAFAAA